MPLGFRLKRRQALGLLGGLCAAALGLGAGCGEPRPTPTPDAPDEEAPPLPCDLHPAEYWQALAGHVARCDLCWHRCTVAPGQVGFCKHRRNVGGAYYSMLYGRPSALQIDPVEKEPALHVLPGAPTYGVGTAGCNNRCLYCHNWHLSQREVGELRTYPHTPEQIVEATRDADCDAISFTFNEPTIFYEYMRDTAAKAREAGLLTMFHTNGGLQREPLKALLPLMHAVTVDLKAFSEGFYREVCASSLEPVLRTLETIREAGVHLEIVNLIVTTLNDNPDELQRMCAWIASTLGVDVPLHFTRFMPAYRLQRLPPTPLGTLEQAAEIADAEGLEYVYIGAAGDQQRRHTYCPRCGEGLIYRKHFTVLEQHLVKGCCPQCGHRVPGIWWEDWR